MLCCRCDTSRRRCCVPLHRSPCFVLHFSFFPHSVLLLLTFLSHLPSSLPSSIRPDSLHPLLTSRLLLSYHFPFFPWINSTLLQPSCSICVLSGPLPSPLLLRRLLWGSLLSLIGHSPLLSCKNPFLPLSGMSPCRRGGTPTKRTAPKGVCFHGTHRSGLIGGASLFLLCCRMPFPQIADGAVSKDNGAW